ncbi:TetR/AcrR family transcriptional regulator [Kribbella sandramycini]|uniref:AcrR family transcriptional regulator n=1 Tax=Kribbella sandramycini TaxID=60450 RepID=A0A7Y4L9F7_9ACTN|nr:TetR/AcrR family transcriptional regulator [Kribbella sandramycini]MBB6570276.1 AcrR family transcriptional regulator [Kribbella sandramycini]NOL45806.1 TetR/AcrR family transcriptional regulator [Kribbella sandramycini]
MASTTGSRGPSEARARLIRTATELFYAEGITAVGVERLIAEAGVTRVTFYRHFPSKEDLVLAYLQAEDEAIQGAFAAAAASGAEPRALVELVIQALGDDIERQHTRGCPFINAAAEYPDASSPIRKKIAEHREWFRSTLEQVITAAELPDPAEKAGALVLLRDAAMVGGYLDGPEAVRPTFERTAREVLGV